MKKELTIEQVQTEAFKKYSDVAYAYRVFKETDTTREGYKELKKAVQEAIETAENVYSQIENVLNNQRGVEASETLDKIKEYRDMFQTIKKEANISSEPNM